MSQIIKRSILGVAIGVGVALLNIIFISMQELSVEIVVWVLLLWTTCGFMVVNLTEVPGYIIKSVICSVFIASPSLVYIFASSISNGLWNIVTIVFSSLILGWGIKIGIRKSAK